MTSSATHTDGCLPLFAEAQAAPKQGVGRSRDHDLLNFLRRVHAEGDACLPMDDVVENVAYEDASKGGFVEVGGVWSTFYDRVALTGRGLETVRINASCSGYQAVKFPPTLWERIARLVQGWR